MRKGGGNGKPGSGNEPRAPQNQAEMGSEGAPALEAGLRASHLAGPLIRRSVKATVTHHLQLGYRSCEEEGSRGHRSRHTTRTHSWAAQQLCPLNIKAYTYSASQAAPGGSVATGDTAVHRHSRKSPVHTSSGGAGLSSLGALHRNKCVTSSSQLAAL